MGAIKNSGQLGLSEIQVAIFGSSGTQGDLNNSSYRLIVALGGNNASLPSNSQFKWSDYYGKGILSLSNSGTTTDYNLRSSANSAGYGGTYTSGKTLISFTNSGTIGASSTGVYGFRTGSFASGDKVQVTNASGAYIVGAGGNGGDGGSAFGPTNTGSYGLNCQSASGGNGGAAGGNAMYIDWSGTYLTNNGVIGGGGGGGQGAGGVINYYGYGGGAGGGGAGYGGGAGGGGGSGWYWVTGGTGPQPNYCAGPYFSNQAGNGDSGTLTTGGQGSTGGLGNNGSNGGDLGQNGASGAPHGYAIVNYAACIYSGGGTLPGGTA